MKLDSPSVSEKRQARPFVACAIEVSLRAEALSAAKGRRSTLSLSEGLLRRRLMPNVEWSSSLFDFSGLAQQERAYGHGHRMESQRTCKFTEVGEPFRMGEDPSHHIHYSDKAKHQQQDTNNP